MWHEATVNMKIMLMQKCCFNAHAQHIYTASSYDLPTVSGAVAPFDDEEYSGGELKRGGVSDGHSNVM